METSVQKSMWVSSQLNKDIVAIVVNVSPSNQMCQHAIKTGGGEFTIAQQDEQIYKEASSGKYYVKYGGPESR